MTAVFACLFDVHGSLLALEAVLQDARRAGATAPVRGADHRVPAGRIERAAFA